MTTPAVIYAAKSTQDRHESIATQLEEGRELCDENGWTVVGEFQDEGFSAYSGNRGPGLEDAKARAAKAAAEFDTTAMLVAQAHDRFARGAGDRPGAPQSLGEIWHEMRRLNVWLRTVEDDEELRDEASVAAIGRRAHIDSARKSKSVKKGMRRRAKRGLFNGRFPPYGYRRVDGLLMVVASEAEIVRRIFREYVAGRSQQAIARGLNGDDVPTQQGRQWYQGSVRAILVNPTYRGKIPHGDDEYDGQHEAIVDDELWAKAQQLREANARTTGHGRGRRPKGRHLFVKGHLKCGACGSSMDAVTKPNRANPDYEVYACSGRKRNGTDYCPVGPVARAPVDGAAFAVWGATQPELRRMEAELLESIEGERAHVEAERERAEREQLQAEAAYTRVRDHYQQGRIEPEDWQEQRPELQEAREGARARVERLKARETEVVADGAMVADAGLQLAEKLVSIVTSIFSESVDPDAIDEARASVRRIFDECVLKPVPQDELASWSGGGITLDDDPDDPPSGLNGTFALIPKLNERVLADWLASAHELDSRAGTYLGGNKAKGLQT